MKQRILDNGYEIVRLSPRDVLQLVCGRVLRIGEVQISIARKRTSGRAGPLRELTFDDSDKITAPPGQTWP